MRIRMQNREGLLSWFGAQWKSWRMFWIIKRVQHIMNSNSIRLQTDLMPTGCEVVADNHYHAHFCERSPHCRRQQPLFHFQPSIYLCWTQSNTNLDFKLQPDLPYKLVQPVPLSPTMELVSSTMFQPPSVHWKRYICNMKSSFSLWPFYFFMDQISSFFTSQLRLDIIWWQI